MIEINNLTKSYGKIKAVDDISFTVNKGEIVGFLGPNGAGKSTTMNIITGFLPSTSGTVKVCGFDILEQPEEVKKRIGYLPELPPLYMDMTVREYMNFICEIKKVPKEERELQINQIYELVKIAHVSHRLIKNLSKGYKQRVGLAQALVGKPEVLILDEPTVGLDPAQIIEIRKLIKSLSKNHTIILSSHILPEVSAVCDRVIIINKGKIAAEDSADKLAEGSDRAKRFTILVDGSKNGAQGAIAGVYGVKSINFMRKRGNYSEFLFEIEGDVDPRKAINMELVKKGFAIMELKPLELTLEETFMDVVTHDTGVKKENQPEEQIDEVQTDEAQMAEESVSEEDEK